MVDDVELIIQGKILDKLFIWSKRYHSAHRFHNNDEKEKRQVISLSKTYQSLEFTPKLKSMMIEEMVEEINPLIYCIHVLPKTLNFHHLIQKIPIHFGFFYSKLYKTPFWSVLWHSSISSLALRDASNIIFAFHRCRLMSHNAG